MTKTLVGTPDPEPDPQRNVRLETGDVTLWCSLPLSATLVRPSTATTAWCEVRPRWTMSGGVANC